MKKTSEINRSSQVQASTRITGLDEITGGGLPHGRTTLLAGGPGSGKIIFGERTMFVSERANP